MLTRPVTLVGGMVAVVRSARSISHGRVQEERIN